MARFKGKAAAGAAAVDGQRPDLLVLVAVAVVLVVAVVLAIWFAVDRTGFMIWWDSLGMAVRR